MSIILKDNSPVPEKYRDRCLAIQDSVGKGQCSLIDLLDTTGKKAQDPPQIFTDDGKRTWNLVGVFDGAVEQVVIGDRFGPEQAANDSAEGGFLSPFVRAMLEKCWDDTPLWLLNEFRTSGETDIFDRLLMLKLAAQLERAWKRGRFRLYRTFPHYDCRVRGQLDLPRKIRMSMGLEDGRMAYQVREYSEDNLYNQLFFQACLEAEKRQPEWMRQLRQRMQGFRMARQALEQQNAGWGRGDTHSLLNGTRKKIANPVYRDYETLRVVARAVLKRSSHSSYPYTESGAPFVTGIFLDVSKLWEDYLYKAVLQGLSPQPETQKSNLILDGLLNLRPDFLWDGEKRTVLDAKFRTIWGEILEKIPNTDSMQREKIRETVYKAITDDDRKEIKDDVYQVLSYILTLDCTHGGVIFPVGRERTSEDSAQSFSAVNGRSERKFWLIPFFVPQNVDYKEFSKAMGTEAERMHDEVEEKFLKDDPGLNS